MAEPFLGEIRMMSFYFAPKNWATCNGQLLPIQQNPALFSLLGTYYGGDGRVTFGLPDLRSRTPVSLGDSIGFADRGGAESVALGISQLPGHSHAVACQNAAGTTKTAAGNLPAKDSKNYLAYKSTGGAVMAAGAIGNQGGGQAHNNMQPFLTINFCIALAGIFPSRS